MSEQEYNKRQVHFKANTLPIHVTIFGLKVSDKCINEIIAMLVTARQILLRIQHAGLTFSIKIKSLMCMGFSVL